MTAPSRRMLLVNLGLVAAIAAVLAVVFGVGSGRIADPGAEPFAGSDGRATELAKAIDPTFEPALDPLFEVESGEVESGLFALQAGIGGTVLGYAIGALSTRRRYERKARSAE